MQEEYILPSLPTISSFPMRAKFSDPLGYWKKQKIVKNYYIIRNTKLNSSDKIILFCKCSQAQFI